MAVHLTCECVVGLGTSSLPVADFPCPQHIKGFLPLKAEIQAGLLDIETFALILQKLNLVLGFQCQQVPLQFFSSDILEMKVLGPPLALSAGTQASSLHTHCLKDLFFLGSFALSKRCLL